MPTPKPPDWDNHIVPLLRDDIKHDPDVYYALVDEGKKDAIVLAAGYVEREGPFLSVKALKEVHYAIFQGAYKPDVAGEFRGLGELRGLHKEIQVGGIYGTFSANIERDLAALNRESKALWEKASSLDEQAKILICYHAKLDAIQPFRDGNTRTALTILEAQAEKYLGHSLDHDMNWVNYKDARFDAWDANNKVSHHGVENYVGCAYLSIEVHPTKGKSIELSAEAIILVEQPRSEKAKAIPHTKTGEISMHGNAIFRGFEITIGSEKWTVSKT